jgi:hypothetical protein
VILEILVKQVNTDEKRHSDTSSRCATRRQRTRDADDWWRGAAAEDDDVLACSEIFLFVI